MSPEQRQQAIARMAADKHQLTPACQYMHELVAVVYSGPLSPEERALSDQAIAALGDCAFYHGGLEGRQPGDMLLPSSVTGSDPRGQAGHNPDRATHVYFSQHKRQAARYARLANGVVYRVQPLGAVEADPAWLRTAMTLHEATGCVTWHPEFWYVACPDWRSPTARVVEVMP